MKPKKNTSRREFIQTTALTGAGMMLGGPLKLFANNNSNPAMTHQVNFNASLIGGIPETQEVVHYCANNGIHPEVQIIKAEEVNKAWENVVNKKARYRYVIDAATFKYTITHYKINIS